MRFPYSFQTPLLPQKSSCGWWLDFQGMPDNAISLFL
jgi:hypothetical protein